jgi:hypothetical protein
VVAWLIREREVRGFGSVIRDKCLSSLSRCACERTGTGQLLLEPRAAGRVRWAWPWWPLGLPAAEPERHPRQTWYRSQLDSWRAGEPEREEMLGSHDGVWMMVGK